MNFTVQPGDRLLFSERGSDNGLEITICEVIETITAAGVDSVVARIEQSPTMPNLVGTVLALTFESRARPHEYQIPQNAPVTHCSTCGKEIVFSFTAKGARVPLSLATKEERGGVAYAQSHFLDCPHAAAHSRRPKQKEQRGV